MESEAPPIECWFIVSIFGILVFTYNEFRKFIVRCWPEKPFVCVFKL